jgi:hypothetical protein
VVAQTSEHKDMSEKYTGMDVTIIVHLHSPDAELVIDYIPIADSPGSPNQRKVLEYKAQFGTRMSALPELLLSKLVRIGESLLPQVTVPELDLGDVKVQGTISPWYYVVSRTGRTPTHLAYRVGASTGDARVTPTDATSRMLSDVWPSIEQMAWNHFRASLGAPVIQGSTKKKVFVSYRKGSGDVRRFVEEVAHRLGREGFLPWFDEWELVAGDSLPREIGDGLQDVYAIIIVLTTDYPNGRWAREELENAITQRVERGTKVIPVLYEDCDRPELLRPLVYVDCKRHEPDEFERQFIKIIDSLNEIDLNPYRR